MAKVWARKLNAGIKVHTPSGLAVVCLLFGLDDIGV
jgi:hypothetical protein